MASCEILIQNTFMFSIDKSVFGIISFGNHWYSLEAHGTLVCW